MSVLKGLEPVRVYKHFEKLASIPRASKSEARVLEHLKSFASQHGLTWSQDAAGNLVVRRPGSGGGEGAPTVVLQGHVDMVCEKEKGHDHDFATDPIKLAVEGDWLTAVGTTLGADNGFGVAAALALLEMPKDAKLPPLEGLFTVEEEIGLVGAKALDGSLVEGRVLLNMDAEDWPNIYVGCAGCGLTTISLSCRRDAAEAAAAASASHQSALLSVGGLVGGHSGAEIHKYQANAVKVIARVLAALLSREETAGLCRLVDVAGGDKHNVIPRESEARLLVRQDGLDKAREVVEAVKADIVREYGELEKSIDITLTVEEGQDDAAAAAAGTAPIVPEDEQKVIGLLNLLPHGPIKFSHSIPTLVETSNNLASVKGSEGPGGGTVEYEVFCSTRSSVDGAVEAVRGQFRSLAGLCGGSVRGNVPYPGWQPNLNSRVVKCAVDEVTKLIGSDPKVTAIHAGLECGIIRERLGEPACDMVAFGPTILGAHTPEERLQISTVEPFWKLLSNIVQNIAGTKRSDWSA